MRSNATASVLHHCMYGSHLYIPSQSVNNYQIKTITGYYTGENTVQPI
jgi:hypothetical protein